MLKDLKAYLAESGIEHLHVFFTMVGIDEPQLLAKLRYSDLEKIGIDNLIERRKVFDIINDINQDMYAEEMALKEDNDEDGTERFHGVVRKRQDHASCSKSRAAKPAMHETSSSSGVDRKKGVEPPSRGVRDRSPGEHKAYAGPGHSPLSRSRLSLGPRQDEAGTSANTSLLLGEMDGSSTADESGHRGARITVCVRKRPCAKPSADIVDVASNMIAVNEPRLRVDLEPYTEKHRFSYDYCFDGNGANGEIYEKCVREVVEHVTSNGSGTVLAYGQTGTGKTYTMLERDIGIVYLALKDILRSERTGAITFCEIYMGQVYDLLNGGAKVALREANGVVHLTNSREIPFRTIGEAYSTIEAGLLLRKTGTTGANAKSSRSHAIIIARLIQEKDAGARPGPGTIFFVDLAGSERGSDRRDTNVEVKNEGTEINKSLLALKECIRGIERESRHLPFRQSKLTQILKNSLVGSSRTCLIATVSSSPENVEHTLNTLRYAARVKGSSPSEQRDGDRSIHAEAPQRRMSLSYGLGDPRHVGSRRSEIAARIKQGLVLLSEISWSSRDVEELEAVLSSISEIERRHGHKP
jgi:kinesin family member 2/24